MKLKFLIYGKKLKKWSLKSKINKWIPKKKIK